jgi:hypothetical protein
MKNYFLLFALSLALQVNLRAQWLPSSGIDGAYCTDIVKIDSSVFMCAEGVGIVKQHMDSTNWTIVYPNKVSKLMSTGNVLIAKETIYGSSNMMRSFDLGITWDSIPLDSLYVQEIVALDTTLFVWSLSYYSLYKSEDYGQRWDIILSKEAGTRCSLFSDEYNLYYLVDQGPLRLYFSDDHGNSFDSIPLPQQIIYPHAVEAIQKFDSTLFLIADSLYLYSFPDQTWDAYANKHDFSSFTVNNNILFGYGEGIFNYAPSSGQWMQCDSGLISGQVHKVKFVDGYGYCTNSYGCYKSDSTFVWQPNNSGLQGGNIFQVAVRGNEVWVCSSIGLYKSSDGGISFTLKINPAPDRYMKIILTDSLYFLQSNSGILISADYGENWIQHLIDSLSQCTYITDFDIGSEYIFALAWVNSGEKLYRSRYEPIAWEPVAGSEINVLHYIAAHDSIVMISKSSSDNEPDPVYISFDNGIGLSPASFLQQAYDVKVKYENGKFFALNRNKIYCSTDNGSNWDNMTVSDPEFVLSDVSQSDGRTIAAGWFYEYIPKAYITNNNGLSWTNIAGNLSDPDAFIFTCSAINGARTFIGTYSKGLWYRDDILTDVPETFNPDNICMQILPNPAPDKFEIQFTAAQTAGNGIISISDVNGRVVYSDEDLIVKLGVNHFQVEAGKLADGIYVATVATGNEKFWGKLVIAR